MGGQHVAEHGATPDGYLFQGRKYKLVVRRSHQEDFQRAAARAGLPPEFVPHSLRHLYASTAPAEGIPITEVSRWLGHNSIEGNVPNRCWPPPRDRPPTCENCPWSTITQL